MCLPHPPTLPGPKSVCPEHRRRVAGGPAPQLSVRAGSTGGRAGRPPVTVRPSAVGPWQRAGLEGATKGLRRASAVSPGAGKTAARTLIADGPSWAAEAQQARPGEARPGSGRGGGRGTRAPLPRRYLAVAAAPFAPIAPGRLLAGRGSWLRVLPDRVAASAERRMGWQGRLCLDRPSRLQVGARERGSAGRLRGPDPAASRCAGPPWRDGGEISRACSLLRGRCDAAGSPSEPPSSKPCSFHQVPCHRAPLEA